ncbi:hypothetical protein V2J09_017527 [Rumex salicifolius]
MLLESFMQLGSVFATIMFAWAMYQQYIPDQLRNLIKAFILRYSIWIRVYLSPYQEITFDEFSGARFDRNEAYTTIETYLSERSSKKANRMKANFLHGKSLMLSIADQEEVTDEFSDVTVWWISIKNLSKSNTISVYPGSDEKRLVFHRRDRDLVTTSYLDHVLEDGKEITIRKRLRKLYTNTQGAENGYRPGGGSMWSHVEFKHPGRFETLALEPKKKQKIIDDLIRFSNAKDYYQKIGKTWKRGYLLYGPPGTGKSTMVAAIANLLEYDIYDLELTAVKDNIHLRKLLIETSNKSIILIEDIDCSLDLTGERKTDKDKEDGKDGDEMDQVKKVLLDQGKVKGSEVTLSGLLNFIDGIWSSCGEERIIVFTTNYIEKLDPALIRRGRMDMHIELSYCCFDAFKVLAKNYLDLDSHRLFDTIERLLGETNVTPADVAENLMPKSTEIDAETCLKSLILAMEKAKEEDKLKAEENGKTVLEE